MQREAAAFPERPNRCLVGVKALIAIAQHEGPQRGLEEIRAIAYRDRLANYPFFHSALGEFEFHSGRYEIAREHFRAALAVARNPMERQFIEQRMGACELAGPQRGMVARLQEAPVRRVARHKRRGPE